jgi:hypothetical protein
VRSGVRRLPIPKPTTAAEAPERRPTRRIASRNALSWMGLSREE